MKIVVTGAAGYIGSVVTETLCAEGHEVFAIDDLSHGHRAAVDQRAVFNDIDLLDGQRLSDLLLSIRPYAVFHLGAKALIDESVRDPAKFFRTNMVGGLNLLEAMIVAGAKRLIFSSTAAVYGEPDVLPIEEIANLRPVNAYGESKLLFERMLPWFESAYGIRSITFRYFNAAGATRQHGEDHQPETHLIPVVLEVAAGRRESIPLFGTDYDTPDGTCIRDYVHVADIASAHLLAMRKIDDLGSQVFNLGNGTGYSNREVIESVKRVTGSAVTVQNEARRLGDPARLVASPVRAERMLGWHPTLSGLDDICQSAWDWRRDNPKGYDS